MKPQTPKTKTTNRQIPVNRSWTGHYMVMTSLAWTLKAWAGLLLPVSGRWQEKHQTERVQVLRMEFKTFVNAFLKIPCQIVRQARRTIFRVLNWNPHLPTFFRLCTVLKL